MLPRWLGGARPRAPTAPGPAARGDGGAPRHACSSDGTPLDDAERRYLVGVFLELRPGSSALEAEQQLARHAWGLQPALRAAGAATAYPTGRCARCVQPGPRQRTAS